MRLNPLAVIVCEGSPCPGCDRPLTAYIDGDLACYEDEGGCGWRAGGVSS